MKVISFDAARVTQLFPLEEIVPDGLSIPNFLQSIKDKYNFMSSPNPNISREETAKTGLKFENASFIDGNRTMNINSFTIHTDGVVVDARTSADAETFLDGLFEWIRGNFSFKEFISKPKRRFLSQIVVELSKNAARIISNHEIISNELSRHLTDLYEERVEMDFSGFTFEYDKTRRNSSLIVPKFSIERRLGISFDRERYYCLAPLRTSVHIELLQFIEDSIS